MLPIISALAPLQQGGSQRVLRPSQQCTNCSQGTTSTFPISHTRTHLAPRLPGRKRVSGLELVPFPVGIREKGRRGGWIEIKRKKSCGGESLVPTRVPSLSFPILSLWIALSTPPQAAAAPAAVNKSQRHFRQPVSSPFLENQNDVSFSPPLPENKATSGGFRPSHFTSQIWIAHPRYKPLKIFGFHRLTQQRIMGTVVCPGC